MTTDHDFASPNYHDVKRSIARGQLRRAGHQVIVRFLDGTQLHAETAGSAGEGAIALYPWGWGGRRFEARLEEVKSVSSVFVGRTEFRKIADKQKARLRQANEAREAGGRTTMTTTSDATKDCPKCGETGAIDAAEHVEGSLLLMCPGCLQPRDPGPTASEERRAAYERALQELAVVEALGELGSDVPG